MILILCCLPVLNYIYALIFAVLQPPLITIPDRPQTLYYADGTRVLIKCSAEGTPNPE